MITKYKKLMKKIYNLMKNKDKFLFIQLKINIQNLLQNIIHSIFTQ